MPMAGKEGEKTMKAMKLIKAVVVLAVFLGTYALKDFTQFANNVYADGIVIDDGSSDDASPAKPVEKDEEIKGFDRDGDAAIVRCGKDTTKESSSIIDL